MLNKFAQLINQSLDNLDSFTLPDCTLNVLAVSYIII